jgi:hypothetical protein
LEAAVADVFLSYAREDRTRARRIADLLASCGWSVFWDHKIDVGDDWRQTLQSELQRAGVVVVLWSRASVTSSWVHDEAERGRDRLVSVRVDDVPPPIGFGQLQAVNLIGWEGGRAEGIGKLVDAVGHTLRVPPKQQPTIPSSPARRRRMAAAAGLLAAIAVAVPVARWMRTPPPIMNQEIVLDASRGMAAPFDTRPSKLAAAIEALRNRNLHPAENLALRAFGGACRQDDESRLLVPFGTRRRERIVRAAGGLEPQGESTLVSGVIAALADVHPLPHTRRIVVITGHADACYEEAIRELKQRFEPQPTSPTAKNGVTLEMRFIGLALSPEDRPRLTAISNTVGGNVHFVNTVAELNDVLEYVVEFEPAVSHVRNVWRVVGEVAASINGVASNANAKRFDEAVKILDAGEASYADLQASFDSLAGVRLSASFERFYKLAAENRLLQQQLFAAGRAWLHTGPALGDAQSAGYEQRLKEWNDAVAKWNEIISKYNTNAYEMNRLSDAIVKEVRRTA